jgi:hypothetical protein
MGTAWDRGEETHIRDGYGDAPQNRSRKIGTMAAEADFDISTSKCRLKPTAQGESK